MDLDGKDAGGVPPMREGCLPSPRRGLKNLLLLSTPAIGLFLVKKMCSCHRLSGSEVGPLTSNIQRQRCPLPRGSTAVDCADTTKFERGTLSTSLGLRCLHGLGYEQVTMTTATAAEGRTNSSRCRRVVTVQRWLYMRRRRINSRLNINPFCSLQKWGQ